MSDKQEKNFLELITEYAKSNNQDVDLDDVKEAFPEFYTEGPIYKQKQEDALFDQPVFVAELEEVQNAQDINDLKEEVSELRKLIATHAQLLGEIKKDVKTSTPTVDEALLKQRLETFQIMHDKLEKRISKNEEAILIKDEKKEDDKKRAWWIPFFLVFNIILLALLLYLLFGKFSNSSNDKSNAKQKTESAVENIGAQNANQKSVTNSKENALDEAVPLPNEKQGSEQQIAEQEAMKLAAMEKEINNQAASSKEASGAKNIVANPAVQNAKTSKSATNKVVVQSKKVQTAKTNKAKPNNRAQKVVESKKTSKALAKPKVKTTTPKAAAEPKQPAVIFK